MNTYENTVAAFMVARVNKDLSLDEQTYLSGLIQRELASQATNQTPNQPIVASQRYPSPQSQYSPYPTHADSESEMEESYSSSDETGFRLVSGRKRSRANSNGSLTPVNSPRHSPGSSPRSKKTNIDSRPGPTHDNNKFNLLRSPSPIPSTSATVDEPLSVEPTRKFGRIPPIVLHRKTQITALFRTLEDKGIDFSAKNMGNFLHIQTKTPREHSSVTRLLISRKIEHHSFRLPEEKPLKVVIRGIPEEIDTEEVKMELARSYPVISVHRMKAGRSRKPIPLVLVNLTKNEEGKKIFNELTSIFHLRIQVESLRNKTRMGQCFRCQAHGHSANCCHGLERCVKCAGPHLSSDCKKPRDTPAKCALCEGEHTASYKGCPARPQPNRSNRNRFPYNHWQNNYQSHRQNDEFSRHTTQPQQQSQPPRPEPTSNQQLPNRAPPAPNPWPAPHFYKSRSSRQEQRSHNSPAFSQQFRLERHPESLETSQSNPLPPPPPPPQPKPTGSELQTLIERATELKFLIQNAAKELTSIQTFINKHNG